MALEPGLMGIILVAMVVPIPREREGGEE